MTHPLVEQLRFTRQALVTALGDVSVQDGNRHFGTMNSAGWIVGHLAAQEQNYWLRVAQGKVLVPEVDECGSGKPMSTPRIDAMWEAWRTITEAANPYLDGLTSDDMLSRLTNPDTGQPWHENIGTMLHRMTYHYWFHIGESQAIRQLLGHTELPRFVGPIQNVPYRAADDAPVS